MSTDNTEIGHKLQEPLKSRRERRQEAGKSKKPRRFNNRKTTPVNSL